MYPVSERYKTAIRARARTDRVAGTLTLTDGAGGVVSYRTDMIEGDYTLRIMSDRSLLLTAEAVGCKKPEHMPDIPVAANGTVVVIPPAERSSADVSYF